MELRAKWPLVVALCACVADIPAGEIAQSSPPRPSGLLSAADLQRLPMRAPDHRLAYGDHASQVGELRVPAGRGPHPVIVLIHGGCWKAEYATTRDLGPMGDALEGHGIASWNIEYRRLGEPGGGFPGTYLDVGRAIDHLRQLSPRFDIDLTRVAVLGHSAGGHLAMFAGIRQRLSSTSPLYVPDPLRVRGVINLAGTIDMTQNIAHMEATCHDAVVTGLLGGTPMSAPDRYREVSASAMLPLRVPQILVWGEHENFVPLPLASGYVDAATRAGDRARLVVVPRIGHFETASPFSSAWSTVLDAIRSLLAD
jgi:acetyl esterase/lipase